MSLDQPPALAALANRAIALASERKLDVDNDDVLDELTTELMAEMSEDDKLAVAFYEVERQIQALLDEDVASGYLVYDAETDTYRRTRPER